MKHKKIGIALIVGAILYFLVTGFILNHGIHPLNTLGSVIAFTLGFILFFKKDEEETVQQPQKEAEEAEELTLLTPDKKLKILFVSLAFGLLTAIIIALTYLATSAGETLTTILSFAGGVSNIVLPCTLPLVFIIVPLSMGKGYKKGLLMALLFGLGLTVMLAIYGAGIALVGKYLGLDQATKILYLVAGVAAFIFGLSTLALISFQMPSYSRVPSFIQKQPDYFKALFLGFFLGNAGVGCPNPITYLILTAAAGTGSVAVGAWYMAANGLGRALPLVFLSVLGILGVNAAGGLLKHKVTVDKITGWALIAISAFIVLNGIFGHLWYEGSVFHEGLNMVFSKLGGESIAEAAIPIEQFEQAVPYYNLGAWFNLLLPPLILFWYYLAKKRAMSKKTFWILLIIFIIWGLLTMPIGLKMG
ncbi:MAG: sulfite exporter TauE/SafE family protein [Actinobacteria bacterium]|nr:sulfite exporter TauE/SafE family protein [Actinomycetota bacterium]